MPQSHRHINEIAGSHGIAFAFFVISVTSILAGPYVDSYLQSYCLTIYINAIRLCIVLHALIFSVAWNAYGGNLYRNSILLAIAFLCAVSMEFLYIATLPRMSDVATFRSGETTEYFWLMGHIAIAIGIVPIAFIPTDSTVDRRRRNMALIIALAGVATYAGTISLQPAWLPYLHADRPNVISFGNVLDYLLLGLYACTSAVLYLTGCRRPDKDPEHKPRIDRKKLFAATLAMTYAQAHFLWFPAPVNVAGLLGPLYKIIAALFFYRAVVVSNIKAPYAALSSLAESLQKTTAALKQNQRRLAGIIENATDAIITTDESHTIVLANPSSAAMFGTSVQEMQGRPIEKYIPVRHRKGHQGYVKHFGKVRMSFFKMGKSFSDYDVTGLRASGEEFPIEASISSMVENNRRFYTLILRDITERKRAQEELTKSHEELSRLSNTLQTVREQERRNVARELHDDLGQLLAALRIDLSLLQKQAMETTVDAKYLVNMDELLASSIASLRRIATDLRPRALDEGGLYFALQTLRRDFVARHGIACELYADEPALALDDQRSTAIYRIIEESLTNVYRHADAGNVTIAVKRTGTELALTVQDDGHGIRAEDMANPTACGLVDMRERVRAMSGNITIGGEPGRGTRIHITLPL